MKNLKPKKCRVCKEQFQPARSTQIACCLKCAIEWAESQAEKKRKKQHLADKKRIKKLSEWIKETEAAFNRYMRELDHDQPCISCDAPPSDQRYGGQWDAGHYRSKGSAPHLRFEPDNCHKQCVRCNRDLSGNIVEYRKRLIQRIGLDRVEAIENDNTPRHYSADQLEKMKRDFNAEARRIKKEREQCQ